MAKVESEVANPFLSKQSQYDRHPYLALPFRLSHPRSKLSICCISYNCILILLAILLIVVVVAVFLWPSKPHVKLVNIQLNHVNISKNENVTNSLDISMNLKVQIHNLDFVTRHYDILMSLGYEGMWKESKMANGTSVEARSTSSIDLTMQLELKPILHKTSSRIEDILKDSTSLGLAIEIGGNFHLLYLNVPINGRMSCEINVDTENQAIASQDCYPMES
uniref:Hybrid signal transduction histidine kinase M n=1 Tax=Anthurium amnicola TaxID=1678845 RepID=A0A1D1ZD08_9ARAE